MIKYLFFILLALGMLFEIWHLFLSKKSRLSIIFKIIIIFCGGVITIIMGLIAFTPDPFSQRVGVLRPQKRIPYKFSTMSSPGRGSFGMHFDSLNQILEIKIDEDQILQPFGLNVPFSLRKNKNGLLISMIIYSLDSKVVAEIRDNKWVVNPNSYFRINFDKSALEVIDEYNIPVLQIVYLNINAVKIGGIFRCENDSVSKIYPSFPSAKEKSPRIHIFGFGAGNTIFLGSGGTIIQDIRDKKLDDVVNKARKIIKPWFDYSEPKKLGIRLKNSNKL